MGVEAGVAVVPQDQQVARRNHDRSEFVVHRLGTPVGLHPSAVAQQPPPQDLDPVTGSCHHTLDQRGAVVVARINQLGGGMEHHHRAGLEVAAVVGADLLHQDPVLQLEGRKHRSRGNPARFHHQPAQQQRHHQPEKQGEQLTSKAVRGPRGQHFGLVPDPAPGQLNRSGFCRRLPSRL